MSQSTKSDDRVKKLEFLGISPVEVGVAPVLTGVKATKLMHELEERAGKLELLIAASQKAKTPEDRTKHVDTIEDEANKQLEKAKQLGPEAKVIRKRFEQIREDAGKLRAGATSTARKSYAPVEPTETPKQQLVKLAQDLKAIATPDGASPEELKKLNQLRKEAADAIKDSKLPESIKLVGDTKQEAETIKQAVAERGAQKNAFDQSWKQLSAKLGEARDVLPVTAKLKTLKKDFTAAEKTVNDAAKKGEYKNANDTHLPALTKAVNDLLNEQGAIDTAESQLMTEWPAVYAKYKETADVKRTKAGAATWQKLDEAYQDFSKEYAAYNFQAAKTKLPALKKAIGDVLKIPKGEKTDKSLYWAKYHDLEKESSDYDKLLKDAKALEKMAGANLGASADGLAVKKFFDAHKGCDKLYFAHEYKDASKACTDMAGLVAPAEAAVGRLHAQFADCNSKWKGLQDKLKEALKAAESTPKVKAAIADMKTTHGTVVKRMGELQFNAVTVMAIEELARRAGLVVKANKEYETSREGYDAAWKKGKVAYENGQSARTNMKNPPRALISAIASADKIYNTIQDKVAKFQFSDAEALLKGEFDKATDLIWDAYEDARDERTKCQEYYKAQVGPDQSDVQAGTPALFKLVAKLKQAQAVYDNHYKAWDFDAARGAVAAIKVAAKAVADASAEQATAGRPKANAAKDRIIQLTDNGLLDLRGQDEKIKLLTDLQGVPEKLTTDELKAQREIYKKLPMDPKFVAKDVERRKKIVEDVLGDAEDKKEFKSAMGGWPGMPKEKKLALAQKAHVKQCASLGIKPIPVQLVERDPSNCGGFAPSSKVINLNANNKSFQTDFEDVMDTVFHETGHWYQANLVERFNNGEIAPDDDEYAQILMFALNDNRKDAYVPSKQDDETYRKQPQEAHAYAMGNETSKLFCQALSK